MPMSRVALSLAVAAALASADDNRDDVFELGVGEPALSLVRELRQRYPERPTG
ncbi:hypothetical protein [Tahibacter soli]|jgi:hypothetical protein|uniref:Uncharacterized protein n=1 Tax=Tahibacter soli TaxID=2983605 RepID=A0A9X3YPL8_9GAMM|nr:hypothetical protein [Tahibacter soli]MDC8016059.1 hypothetical protein [Tahibacter soli]